MPFSNTAARNLPMHSDVAISVKNLGKTYRIFGHPGDRIKQALTLGQMPYHQKFAALQDVSFDIKKGETVGIIGRNGSGKSTLLQLICGILKPSSGSVQVKGRISALLELGAGFNPEFTGRENVYFQGAVMGRTTAQMDQCFEDIVSFADIGEFIDQPVRTYSSGMFVRLAFAAAIHVEPDILVVDEALAVGDMAFQRKCFERLGQMLSDKQRIVILVSHDLRQVERFCSRAIFLEKGRVIADGPSFGVCQHYSEKSNQDFKLENTALNWHRARVDSSGEVELLSVHLVDSSGLEIHEIRPGDPLRTRIRFRLTTPMLQPELIVGTQTANMQFLSSCTTAELGAPMQLDAGEHLVEHVLDQFPLAPGQYYIRLVVHDKNFRIVFSGEGLSPFVVVGDSREFNRPLRLLDLKSRWILPDSTYFERPSSESSLQG
jgi:lipopolysaccharide transport system ATP-binding protein